MGKTTYIAILEDHPSIVDGYRYRLERVADMKIAGIFSFGEELEIGRAHV